jgi:septal ring factor EnvC (AmiA/AmiB activator)
MKRLFLYSVSAAAVLFAAGETAGQSRSVYRLEEKRRAAQEEIEWTARLLKDTRTSAQASLNRLGLLSEQIVARKEVIGLLNQELELMDKDVAVMNSELGGLEHDLNTVRVKYARSLQNMHARRSIQYKWFFVLSAENFTQSLRRMRYLREYSGWQKRQVTLIVKKQTDVGLKRTEIEHARNEKLALLDIREKEHSQLQLEETEQKTELQQLTQKQKELQAELARKKKDAETLNRQIENLINSEISRALPDDAPEPEPVPLPATRPSGRTSERAKTGRETTKESSLLSGNFAANRGRLPFPLTGKYRIISPFGEHQHPELRHVRTNNNGIDIQTTSGSEAQAIFGGEVTAIFTAESGYNRGVIVRHGRYLTVYANLSEIYVKNGDKVSTQQKLGKIHTDSNRTTVLHFEIRREKEKLNPQTWLKR